MSINKHIDPEMIVKFREIGGDGFAIKMIDLFMKNAPIKIEEARLAEQKEDWESVSRAVHALKSSAGNFGAAKLVYLASEIEELVDKGETNRVPSLLRQIEENYDIVRDELLNEKKELMV